MTNACVFSPCRRYRYSLEHRWDDLMPVRRILWIGLNPSTADEQQLDPTLRRIKNFSDVWGFNCFVMTNLFAFRATRPEDMKAALDPVGPQNDATLTRLSRTSEMIVAAWGKHGSLCQRERIVTELIRATSPQKIHCLAVNADGSPKHPLYVKGDTLPTEYDGAHQD